MRVRLGVGFMDEQMASGMNRMKTVGIVSYNIHCNFTISCEIFED